jgi:hypothetical protein
MMRATRVLGVLFPLLAYPLCPLQADVTAFGQINLTQLTITASQGTIEYLPPIASPPGCTSANLCAAAFSQALDSLGGFDQQFTVADNGATANSASTSLAFASAAASAPDQTAASLGSIAISQIAASASTSAQGSLAGTFWVVDTTGPVTLQFAATLMLNQSLQTDPFGLLAFSEVIFNLDLSTGDVPLFYDNPLIIGPSDSVAFATTTTLTGSVVVDSNTPLFLIAQTDAETQAVNAYIPEPSTAVFLVTVLALCGGIAARRAFGMPRLRRSQP